MLATSLEGLSKVEEHLLICERCRVQLCKLEEYADVMRVALGR